MPFNNLSSKLFRHPARNLLVCLALLSTISGGQPCWAQPGNSGGQDQETLRQLRDQLQQLQNRLDRVPESNMGQRVKSIGSTTFPTTNVVPEQVLQLRLYDLSDLFVVSPHYPARFANLNSASVASQNAGEYSHRGGGLGGGGLGGGGFGGGGGTFRIAPEPNVYPFSGRQGGAGMAASVSLSSAQVSMDQLIQAIQRMVAPNRWGDGDDDARIETLGNTLLITATEDMHRQIANLIDLFREQWGKRRTITIKTFWVRGSKMEGERLLDRETQETIGAGVVNEQRWSEFIEAAERDQRVVFSATLTGHNNQTLHAVSGRHQLITLTGEPITQTTIQLNAEGDQIAKARKPVGIAPVRNLVHLGPQFQATGLATRGGNFVILDLHAQFVEPVKDPRAGEVIRFNNGDGTELELELEHGTYRSSHFSSTVRCPKEQVILAGAMTFENSPIGNQANPFGEQSDYPNLLLFVKTTIHTIEEDTSDWSQQPSQDETPKTEQQEPESGNAAAESR